MINLYDRLDSLLTNNVEVSLIPLEYSFTDVPGLVYNIKNGDFILEPGGTSIKTFKPEYILSIVPRPRLMGIEVQRWTYTHDGDFIHLYIDVPPIERIDLTPIVLHPTETGFHWDIPDFLPYLENDQKIVSEFFNKIYGNLNHIDRIISQPPATIIFWGNGEKTVVKTEPDDEYDLEKGILYAILKHVSTKKDYDHYLRTIDKEVEPNGETN